MANLGFFSAFVRFDGEQAVEAVRLPLADALHHSQHGAHRPVGVLGIDGSAGVAHHDHFGIGRSVYVEGGQQADNKNEVSFSHYGFLL
jgi:hypothetical protein